MQKRQDKLERKKQRSQDKTSSGPEIDWSAASEQHRLNDDETVPGQDA